MWRRRLCGEDESGPGGRTLTGRQLLLFGSHLAAGFVFVEQKGLCLPLGRGSPQRSGELVQASGQVGGLGRSDPSFGLHSPEATSTLR